MGISLNWLGSLCNLKFYNSFDYLLKFKTIKFLGYNVPIILIEGRNIYVNYILKTIKLYGKSHLKTVGKIWVYVNSMTILYFLPYCVITNEINKI